MHCVLEESATAWALPALAVVRASRSWLNPFNRLRSSQRTGKKNMKQLGDRVSRWKYSSAIRAFGVGAAVGILTACASVGGGGGGTVTNDGATPGQNVGSPDAVWPIKSREHVDLWLHGFALLQEDTTFVPFFKRGYSTSMIVLKNRANVVTQLDANRDRLRARLSVNPQLINAQFVPLSFASWSDLSQAVDLFTRSNGDPRA